MRAMVVLLGLLFGMVALGEEAWPRFRGPGGQGVAATPVPVELGVEQRLWSTPLPGAGTSSPVISKGELFVLCELEDEVRLVCLDAKRGGPKWSLAREGGKYRTHRFNNRAAGTPVVSGERVVFAWFKAGHERVMVTAVDRRGEEVWQVDLGGFEGQHGPSLNLELAGDAVIAANLHMAGGFVRALALEDGAERWKVPYPAGDQVAYSAPLARDGEVIVTGATIGAMGIDAESGEVRWQLREALDKRTVGAPVEVAPGLVQVGCKQGTYRVLRFPDGGGAPEIAWTLEKGAPYVPTPVSDGETLYILEDGGLLQAVAVGTGELRWRTRIPGNFYASPLLIGGKLYCLSRDGEMFVLDPARQGEVLAAAPLEPGDEAQWTDATPAAVDGRLYVRLGARLDCYGEE